MSRQQDAAIAADMALAAIDNRESWDALTEQQQRRLRLAIEWPIPGHARSFARGAPLYLMASETARRTTPIWILED